MALMRHASLAGDRDRRRPQHTGQSCYTDPKLTRPFPPGFITDLLGINERHSENA
jgi:hypothetical protein